MSEARPRRWFPAVLQVAAVVGAAATAASAGCGTAVRPLAVVTSLDVRQYMGTWYEIARLPNRFQRQCAGDVTATYRLRPDDRIDVVNECRREDGAVERAEGVARRVDGEPPSVLKVRFAPRVLSWLPMVWGDYQVIELGAAYDYALVGTPSREYLWILARKPAIDAALRQRLLTTARGQGFDAARLVPTPQSTAVTKPPA